VAVLGVALLAFSSVIGVWSARAIANFGSGTPLPGQMANHLVTRGPYSFVRNPMAIAGIVQGVSMGVLIGSWLVVVYALVGSLLWNWLIRPHEEADLYERFGDEYREYADRVYCWWPRYSQDLVGGPCRRGLIGLSAHTGELPSPCVVERHRVAVEVGDREGETEGAGGRRAEDLDPCLGEGVMESARIFTSQPQRYPVPRTVPGIEIDAGQRFAHREGDRRGGEHDRSGRCGWGASESELRFVELGGRFDIAHLHGDEVRTAHCADRPRAGRPCSD
jgi:hypothetical protein